MNLSRRNVVAAVVVTTVARKRFAGGVSRQWFWWRAFVRVGILELASRWILIDISRKDAQRVIIVDGRLFEIEVWWQFSTSLDSLHGLSDFADIISVLGSQLCKDVRRREVFIIISDVCWVIGLVSAVLLALKSRTRVGARRMSGVAIVVGSFIGSWRFTVLLLGLYIGWLVTFEHRQRGGFNRLESWNWLRFVNRREYLYRLEWSCCGWPVWIVFIVVFVRVKVVGIATWVDRFVRFVFRCLATAVIRLIICPVVDRSVVCFVLHWLVIRGSTRLISAWKVVRGFEVYWVILVAGSLWLLRVHTLFILRRHKVWGVTVLLYWLGRLIRLICRRLIAVRIRVCWRNYVGAGLYYLGISPVYCWCRLL